MAGAIRQDHPISRFSNFQSALGEKKKRKKHGDWNIWNHKIGWIDELVPKKLGELVHHIRSP